MVEDDRPARRSQAWWGLSGKLGSVYRSHSRSEGLPDEAFDGRPVIAIVNTGSDAVPCNAHLSELVAHVKAGVWSAGGVPLECRTFGLGETMLRPTAMLYRNLVAMEVEEALRANPFDGAVLLGGCDKTTPALVMAAASVDLPSVLMTGGPMINGCFRGEVIGSGTDVWRLSEEVRAGRLPPETMAAAEAGLSRSAGHCTTMGTASTMACLTEALGFQLPGSATHLAVEAERRRNAFAAGRRAVELVQEDLRPSAILTREAFENAIRTNAAIGGSTNAVVHLLAMAGRAEVRLDLADIDRLGREVPTLVNLKPTGEWLMEDLERAGGLPAVLAEIADLLHLDALTVTGKPLGEAIANAQCFDRRVIRPRDDPLLPPGRGTAVLFGNLCPDGAVLKLSAASPELCRHRGRAVVFDSIEAYDEAAATLDVDASSVLVLRNAGPIGYPGMPEVGNLGLPAPLLRRGVRDMVRISDARMSGTSYGTVVLHVAPEAAAGGPLALVQTGDWITLDADARRLELEVEPAELERRRAALAPPQPPSGGGWVELYRRHVLQADRGCDLDFLVGRRGAPVPRRST
jgi:dihydroxy-acid dehydratase